MPVDRMWWCSGCNSWVGCRLDTCPSGHDRPEGATRHGDVEEPEFYHQRADARRERLKRWLRSRWRRWSA